MSVITARLGRVVVAVAAGALLTLAVPGAPASAHVTVDPEQAEAGGYARVAFRVPNESESATTTKLQVHLPKEHPLTSVRTTPVPGWTAKVEKRKLERPLDHHGTKIDEVVSVITWTAAEGSGVKPSEFVEFPLSLGPLPESGSLVFKVLQTYDDGEVSRWIEEPSDGPEPEHPAPVVTVAEQPSGASHAGNTGSGAADATSDRDRGRDTPLWLGVTGLIAGLAGLALGGLAFARSRRA
ncbi:MAG: YcnI family protein [Micromonosporaceae bacterium]